VASLELRNKFYRVVFMYAGKKYAYSLDTGEGDMAEALRGGDEKTLMHLGQGLLRLTEGADVVAFVKAGGKVGEPPPSVAERLHRRLPSPTRSKASAEVARLRLDESGR
jgi:hypothetical protein